MLVRWEDLRRLAYNSINFPQHERNKSKVVGLKRAYARGNICHSDSKTFHILPVFSDKSSFPLQHLKCVISHDMWVSHNPPLYSSIWSFITTCPRSILFSTLPGRLVWSMCLVCDSLSLSCVEEGTTLFWHAFHL